MLELLVTFIVIFVPILISFIIMRGNKNIFRWFIFIFIFIHVFHFVVLCILLSKNFYKKIIIWKDNDYQFIHSLPVNFIKEIDSEKFLNLNYTLKQSGIYSNKCLDNFFIKEEFCPLDNLSILYDSQNNTFNLNKYNEDESAKEKEVKRVIHILKDYADYSDIICFSFFFISIALMILDLIYYIKIFHIFAILTEIVLLFFYSIRYNKFIDLKELFNKYKDFILSQYENNSSYEYFPNKYFNIDSFALAIQINMVIFIILYSSIFEECLIKNKFLNKEEEDKGETHFIYVLILIYVYLFTTIVYLVMLKKNYSITKKTFEHLKNNWNLNPITSINLSNKDNYNISLFNNKLYFETINFDYKSLFYENKYEDSKICGKDSYGNDLYFPKDVACPINDIIIDYQYFDKYSQYISIKLQDNLFLYYTNKKIDGKIITNLTLNDPIKDSNESIAKSEYNNFAHKSYFEIYNDNDISLFSIYYFGINPEILPKAEGIKKFESKIKHYLKLAIAIIVMMSIYIFIYFILFFIAIYKSFYYNYYDDWEGITMNVIFTTFWVIILILSSITLSISENHIINFMNKINETFESNKINFPWEIMIIINLTIIPFIIVFPIIFYKSKDKFANFMKESFENLCEFGCCCICFKGIKKNNNNTQIINVYDDEIKSLKNRLNDNYNGIRENLNKIKDRVYNHNESYLEKNESTKIIKEIKDEISSLKQQYGNIQDTLKKYSEKIEKNENNINNNKNDIIYLKSGYDSIIKDIDKNMGLPKDNSEKIKTNENKLMIIKTTLTTLKMYMML